MALSTRALAVFALGALVFAMGVRGPYHFDDWVTPVADPASQSIPHFFEHAFRTLRPLSKLTFAVEGSLGWAGDPALRRLVSVCFHAASSALVFVLAARLRSGLWAAFVAASIYALHPIHAEMVWALAGRGAAMGTTLGLAALLAQARGQRWVAAGLLLAAASSRETAVLFVLPMVALEASRGLDLRTLARRIEPAATSALLVVAFVAKNARYRTLAEYSLLGRPFGWSVAGQIEAVPHGLSLYVRPGALSIDHGVSLAHSFAAPIFWLGVASLAAFVWLAVWGACAREPALAVGAAIVLAALLPTQSVIPKLDPLTERPLATALSGVCLVLARGLAPAFRHRKHRAKILALAAGVALALAVASIRRGALYASDVALFRDAAEKSVVNPRPHQNLALALLEVGRVEEARSAVARARRIDPFDNELRALASRLEAGDSPGHR